MSFWARRVFAIMRPGGSMAGHQCSFSIRVVSMQPLVNMALRAARAAAEQIMLQVDRRDRIKIVRDDESGRLTSIDQEAEQTILHHLQKTYPRDSYTSRTGLAIAGESNSTWLIDPLLGSRNFLNGHPLFGVSIAFKSGNTVDHSVLLLPMVGEEYWASRGQGAQLNSRRIRLGSLTEFDSCMAAVDDSAQGLAMAQALLEQGAMVRCSGSTAIDLVFTAADKLQCGWSGDQVSPSMAAALLIFAEAGGLACTESGHPDLHKGTEMLFANPRLCKSLLKLRQAVNGQDRST
ncbi:MAG: inositol monophosphatase [Gammaproteobacteria bacterium]